LRHEASGKEMDVGVLKAGGFANIKTHDAFCPNLDCVISDIYDQSPQGNHLYQRHGLVNASRHKIGVGDPSDPIYVYGMWFKEGGGEGYHTDHTTGIAVNNEPESIYAVMSGSRNYSKNGDGCCFDYGNSENSITSNNKSVGSGAMEAIYFGNTHWMNNTGDMSTSDGPWLGADLEAGMYYGGGDETKVNKRNKPLLFPFVSLYLRGSVDGFTLKGGDATKGEYTTMFDGTRPNCTLATVIDRKTGKATGSVCARHQNATYTPSYQVS
jgi:hypothetical protein